MPEHSSPIPASSLLDLTRRRVPPFDRPCRLVEVERVWFAHTDGQPPLIEGVNEIAYTVDPNQKLVVLSVWTSNMMIGVTLNPNQHVTVLFD